LEVYKQTLIAEKAILALHNSEEAQELKMKQIDALNRKIEGLEAELGKRDGVVLATEFQEFQDLTLRSTRLAVELEETKKILKNSEKDLEVIKVESIFRHLISDISIFRHLISDISIFRHLISDISIFRALTWWRGI